MWMSYCISTFTFADTNRLISDIDLFSVSENFICDPEQCGSFIPNPEQHLKILQQNIRSINCNFNELSVLISRIGISCDIICLSECWLSHVTNLPEIEGYNCCRTSKSYNQNDGVVLYYKSNLNCHMEEPHMMDTNCLLIKFGLETAVVAIYRPHCFKDLHNFFNSLRILLGNIASYKNIIIVGDININLLKSCEDTENYLDLLSYFGLAPAHTHPTTFASCLDHVMIKTSLLTRTFTLQSTLTDHHAVLFCIPNFGRTKHELNKICHRINMAAVLTECKEIDFTSIYHTDDPNTNINFLIDKVSTTISKNSSLKKIPRSKISLKPWMTLGLLRCMQNRDRLQKKLKKDPSNETLKITFKRYRNFCSNLLKRAKRQHEREQIRSAGKNSKKLWDAIRSITNQRKSKENSRQLLSITASAKESVDAVNSFFTGIGKQLAEKIPVSIPPFCNLIYNNSVTTQLNSFVLLDTCDEEVAGIISNLKTDCATGWDGISAKVLKLIKDVVTPPLTHIINACMNRGIFPDALKRSILCPIYKSGNRDCVNNYRPISILTSLSKIFERIINSRLMKYLESHNLLAATQFGFRSGRSTADAVHELTDFIVEKLDSGMKCLTIFLDLAKAFDTVFVPNLINKLEKLGIRSTQLQLFKDYLTNRTQRVKIGDYVSQDLVTEYGVPQGSIMGPTLFLCYINDLCKLELKDCTVISYADDTTLTFYANTWDEVFQKAQSGFNRVCHWLAANSLTLNAEKTKYMTYSITNRHCSAVPLAGILAHKCSFPPSPGCTCPSINVTNSIKYLGVIIDRNLNFKEHTHSVAQRVRKLIFVFKQMRHSADGKILRMVYTALCQSIVSYCITSWGGASKTHLFRLERAQRIVLKICLFKPILFPTTELYRQSEVLTVRQIYILHTVLKQHSMVSCKRDHSTYSARRHYVVCKAVSARTSFKQRFFCFQGGRLYNKINKILNIVPQCKVECKKSVTRWLLAFDYSETEELLYIAV